MQKTFSSCPACLTSLADHLRVIASERDQTRLGGLLLTVLKDTLHARRSAIFRYVVRKDAPFVIALSEFVGDCLATHDAYLISPSRAIFLEPNSQLARCGASGTSSFEKISDGAIYVFPIYQQEQVHLLVEIERSELFDSNDLGLANSILTYYSEHLALIEYAETDTLTGLLNRKSFDEHLFRVLSTASADAQYENSGAHPHRRRIAPSNPGLRWLALIDIDYFKSVNDTHGHLIGDEVLLLLAQKMQESFRLDDQLFRFGGEEFVAVLQTTERSEAHAVLDRFRRFIETIDFPIVGRITVSVGFTQIDYFDNPLDLVDRADKALYYAKKNGRNRVESYETLHEAGLLGVDRVRQKSDVELF